MDPSYLPANLSIQLNAISKLMESCNIVGRSTAGPNYSRFLVELVTLSKEPQTKAFLSEYGRNISLIWGTGKGGLHYLENGMHWKPLDSCTNSEERKAFFLNLGYGMTTVYAGIETAKYLLPGRLGEIAASISPGTFEQLHPTAPRPIALVNVAFHYFNLSSLVENPPSKVPSDVEKRIRLSTMVSSTTSVAQVGFQMAGWGVTAGTLGWISAGFAVMRLYNLMELSKEQKSPFLAIQREVVVVLDKMYNEAENKYENYECDYDVLEEIQKIYEACREDIKQAKTDADLENGIFVVGTLFAFLNETHLVDKEIGATLDKIQFVFSEIMTKRHQDVAQRCEKLEEHLGFLLHQIDRLDEALFEYNPEGDAVGSAIPTKIEGLKAQLREEVSKSIALLRNPSDKIVMTPWNDAVDDLCTDKRQKKIERKVDDIVEKVREKQ